MKTVDESRVEISKWNKVAECKEASAEKRERKSKERFVPTCYEAKLMVLRRWWGGEVGGRENSLTRVAFFSLRDFGLALTASAGLITSIATSLKSKSESRFSYGLQVIVATWLRGRRVRRGQGEGKKEVARRLAASTRSFASTDIQNRRQSRQLVASAARWLTQLQATLSTEFGRERL
jgi:hypothetical protein